MVLEISDHEIGVRAGVVLSGRVPYLAYVQSPTPQNPSSTIETAVI